MNILTILLHGNEPAHVESLFWEGLLFSGITIALVVGMVVWLYVWPLKKTIRPIAAISKRTTYWLVGLFGLSTFLRFSGGFWDRSEHILTGIVPGGEDFLWPPHIMLYASFLVSMLTALYALFLIARPYWEAKVYDPRVWIRNNPYVGAIALAGFYGIASVPGDAIWHELYGLDLTAWSPPHIFIALASTVEGICAAGLLIQSRPEKARFDWRDGVVVLLLALALSMVQFIGVTEWELTRPFEPIPAVVNRPIWLYPLTTAGLAFFMLIIVQKMTPWRWAATATALLFLLVRFANMAFMNLTGGVSPELPLMFILGAFVLDAVPWRTIPIPPLRYLGMGALYTASFYALALPVLADPTRGFNFSALDYTWAVLVTLLVTTALAPLGHAFGTWFRKPATRAATQDMVHQTALGD